MFGERHTSPKPPRYEPFLLLLLGVLIALVVLGAYVGLLYLFERGAQPL
jgi:hypothetical protein